MINRISPDAPDLITQLGRKILVLGSPGSGKSTLAAKLKIILNIDVYNLDSYYWKEAGVRTPTKEWVEILQALVSSDSWIIEGNYASWLDVRAQAADSAILLSPPTHVCFRRVVKRGIMRLVDRRSMPSHLQSSPPHTYFFDLNFRFLGKVIHFNRIDRKLTVECLDGLPVKVLELRSNRSHVEFLRVLSSQTVEREHNAPRHSVRHGG